MKILDTFLNVRKDLSDLLVTFVALDKSYPPSRAEKSSPTKANPRNSKIIRAKQNLTFGKEHEISSGVKRF